MKSVSGLRNTCFDFYLLMTKSLPSTSPAETNSWETPSAESEEHNKETTLALAFRAKRLRTQREKKLPVSRPRPDMNSNRMSFSSFFGFLSLRTRLMGMLALATAGSCCRKMLHLMRRHFIALPATVLLLPALSLFFAIRLFYQ